MSTYEELVHKCHGVAFQASFKDVRSIIAEVLRTLETVTPPMTRAFHSESCDDGPDDQCIWLAMLRVSPLAAPKAGPA